MTFAIKARPESGFPQIKDLAQVLADLTEQGLGDLPIQLVIAPDSTIQALARAQGHNQDNKPALAMEFHADAGRLPVLIMSCDRFLGGGMPTVKHQ